MYYFRTFFPSIFQSPLLLHFPSLLISLIFHSIFSHRNSPSKKRILKSVMGFLKEEKALKKLAFLLVPRWMKTLFFLITMLVSLLLFSAPILLIITDVLLPTALFSASLPLQQPSFTLETLLVNLNSYDFRLSLIDIPLVSIARSAIILCVYSLCDGPRLSRWPYLGVSTVCSAASLVFVSLKGSYVLMNGGYSSGGTYAKATELGLYISSLGLAIGHVAVAYRTSCRERRKLLVYKIDIEAVSACKNGFPKNQYFNKPRDTHMKS